MILASGKSPGERSDYPLQYSCLENVTDRGAWGTAVFGVARSQTGLGATNSFTVTKREKFESVELRWMNLEPVVQKEVSQKEKYCILMYIYVWNLEK